MEEKIIPLSFAYQDLGFKEYFITQSNFTPINEICFHEWAWRTSIHLSPSTVCIWKVKIKEGLK